jgi:hypothetical protein
MAAFNRTHASAPGQIEIIELESTGEGGEQIIDVPLPPDTAVVSVVTEGEGGCHATIDGQALREDREVAFCEAPGRVLFVKANPSADGTFRTLRLRVWTSATTTFRVSVLLVSRLARTTWARVSCPLCKKLLSHLLSVLLAAFGLPALPVDGLIPEELWEKLRHALAVDLGTVSWPTPVTALLEHLNPDFVRQFIDGLRWLVWIVDIVFTPLDGAATALCRRLRLCEAAALERGRRARITYGSG